MSAPNIIYAWIDNSFAADQAGITEGEWTDKNDDGLKASKYILNTPEAMLEAGYRQPAADVDTDDIIADALGHMVTEDHTESVRVAALNDGYKQGVRDARNAALREAANVCWIEVKRRKRQIATSGRDLDRERQHAARLVSQKNALDIEALIDAPAPTDKPKEPDQ